MPPVPVYSSFTSTGFLYSQKQSTEFEIQYRDHDPHNHLLIISYPASSILLQLKSKMSVFIQQQWKLTMGYR